MRLNLDRIFSFHFDLAIRLQRRPNPSFKKKKNFKPPSNGSESGYTAVSAKSTSKAPNLAVWPQIWSRALCGGAANSSRLDWSGDC